MEVPLRKWYIQQWNKRQEKQQNQPATDRPLTDLERQKMISQAQQVQNQPQKPMAARDFLTPQRNTK